MLKTYPFYFSRLTFLSYSHKNIRQTWHQSLRSGNNCFSLNQPPNPAKTSGNTFWSILHQFVFLVFWYFINMPAILQLMHIIMKNQPALINKDHILKNILHFGNLVCRYNNRLIFFKELAQKQIIEFFPESDIQTQS